MSDSAIIITPHSKKQEEAIFDTNRYLLVACGTQWGKTHVGAIRMKTKMHTHLGKDNNFIITAPTYKILNQSTLPTFLKFMTGFGTYNKKDDTFEMNHGGICYCRTETDPDSVVGITNVKHIWCDEAGKYRLYFWENIQARADLLGCGIDLTTSPYSLNWVYRDLIRPYKAGKRKDITYIQAASWENPYHSLFDLKTRELKQAQMDSRRFNMIYGGLFDRMQGLVYDCFDEDQNQVDAFDLPPGTQYYGGIDWGYTDPFVLKIRAITLEGRHYGVSEFYKTGLTVTDMKEVARQKMKVFGITRFYCGRDQPGYIEEFNRAGLPAVGADNDIRRGIDLHYELMKTRTYKMFRGTNPHTIDEIDTYHYPEPVDLKPDQDSRDELPVDQNNHCLDSDRYITISTYRLGFKLTPKVPSESKKQTRDERTEWLKRRKFSYGRQTENWSD